MAPRSLLSAFKGTQEIEKAVTVIGWIAINHARVEDSLDYLVWQLDAFEMAGRRSHRALSADELQARLRKLRRTAKWSPIKNRVKKVGEVLSLGRVATRLRELADGLQFSTE
jgi:hypothetical protein